MLTPLPKPQADTHIEAILRMIEDEQAHLMITEHTPAKVAPWHRQSGSMGNPAACNQQQRVMTL
jgi:hypothetical protein